MSVLLNTVHQGDCIAGLRDLEPGSVDLAFADPPFNIGYDYDVYDDRRSRREYLDWSRDWMAAVHTALKPSGTFWLAIGDEFAAELKVLAQDQVGFTCRSWVIWYYTFGVNCVRGFSRSHTHLFHFVKDPNQFTFNSENPAVRVMSARQLVYGDARANPKGRLPDNTWILRPQDAPSGAFSPSHDTWYYARVAGTFKEREGFHGCQMPEQLLGRIIRFSSNPMDVVLDPFSGSGTTLTVAKKLGRQWLGFELSREYVKRIKDRLDKASVGEPLDGPEDPVASAPKTSKGRKNIRVHNGRAVPYADADTERGIVAAYKKTAKGKSTDYLLCDPELNTAFVAECKKQGLTGGAFVWNRILLRLRKAGQLPKAAQAGRVRSFESMDAYSFASEIAMQSLGNDYGLKIDDILCAPNFAAEFDRIAGEFAPGYSSFDYRWAALAVRKRAISAKKAAKAHCLQWLEKELPRAIPLSRGLSEEFERPGVYVVSNHVHKLYVGETCNLRSRIDALRENPVWGKLDPRSVTVLPEGKPSQQAGLQSILIRRTKPLLNSVLLRPEIEPAGASDKTSL